MSLLRPRDHPHGMDELAFTELFTDHVDVVFAFHGYPGAVHQLVHGRPDADRFQVRGFIEEGTTTTPFDMVVRNRVSRFHLVMDALNNARRTPPGASALPTWCEERLDRHRAYIVRAPRGPARDARLGPGGTGRGAPLLGLTGPGTLRTGAWAAERSCGSSPRRRPSGRRWSGGRAPGPRGRA